MKQTTSTKGFTLIEIIVSVGIFSLVMLVVMAAYLTIIKLDKEARSTNELVSNLNFVVESIGRNVRTGTGYSCAEAGNGQCSQLSFYDSQPVPQKITYLLRNDGTIGQCTSGTCTSTTAVSLTDPRITITALTFYVRGVGTGDYVEPQVLINIRGTLKAQQGRLVDFTIQTGATQRFLEI